MLKALRYFPSRMLSLWAALFIGLMALVATSSQAAAIKFPELEGHRVVDQAHLLSDATKADLELKLKGLEDATSDQMVVVTVDSLQGQEISDYGYQLGRHWGIGQNGSVTNAQGQKYKDNGVILIVAPNERKVRIEVGYGLEPVITDALSSLIINRAILPKFKTGDYEGGIVAGSDAIIQQLSIDRKVAIAKAQAASTHQDSRSNAPIWVFIVIFIVIMIFTRGSFLPWLLLNIFLSGGGRGGGFSGGGGSDWGGGGGGFSGGGGSFGGGGSSGSW